MVRWGADWGPRCAQGIVFSLIMLRIATGLSKVEGETALVFVEPGAVASGIPLSRMSSRAGSERKDSSAIETV